MCILKKGISPFFIGKIKKDLQKMKKLCIKDKLECFESRWSAFE